jgi:hypothetical protein
MLSFSPIEGSHNFFYCFRTLGGALGLFDKGDSIMSTLAELSPTKRLDVYGKDPQHGIDISNPVE